MPIERRSTSSVLSQRRSVYCLLTAALLFSVACSRATGPKGLSDFTYAAIRKAVNALEGASEDRNSSASVFDPKLQTAVNAAEEVYHDIGDQSSDAYAATQIRSCIEDLKDYRANYVSRESDSRPIVNQLKALKGTQMKDEVDVVARNGKDLDECIKAAKAYL